MNAAVHTCIALDTINMYRPLLLRRPPKKTVFGFGGRLKKKSRRLVTPPSRFLFFRSFFVGGGGDIFIYLGFPLPPLPPPLLQYLNKYEVRGVFSSYGAPGARTSQSRARKREDSDRHARQQSANTHTHRGRKKIGGAENVFGGDRKSYLAAEHHNEAAPKKKKSRGFSAWAPKNTTLGRLRSKGLTM